MAWDMWHRKTTDKDYGRGAPPPVGSHEWAGVAESAAEAIVNESKKKAAARAPAPKVATRASVGAEGEGDKKKPWVVLVCGFVVGLIAGSWGRE